MISSPNFSARSRASVLIRTASSICSGVAVVPCMTLSNRSLVMKVTLSRLSCAWISGGSTVFSTLTTVLGGRDPHHIAEAEFKAFARAFRLAVQPDARTNRDRFTLTATVNGSKEAANGNQPR